MSRFQTDSLNPTALNSGVLGRKRHGGPSSHSFLADDPNATSNPDAARDKFANDWNVRIDREMRAVSGGLKELVELADIGTNPTPHTPIPNALHLKIRTAQLIRSTQSIRDMAHELRLMLLLADESGAAARRDAEAAEVKKEKERNLRLVERRIAGILGREEEGGEGVGEANEKEETDKEEEGRKEPDLRKEEGDEAVPTIRESAAAVAQPAQEEDLNEDSDEFEEL